jgi:hypothetical protein
MRFSKTSQKVFSIAMAAVVVAGAVTVPAPKKADAASYRAALYMQTNNYYNRDTLTNRNTCKGIKLKTGAQIKGTSASDKSFKSKGKFSFTVSLKGFKKVKKAKKFNYLGVSTTMPGKMKKKVKNVKMVIKVDGRTVKTIKNPAMEPQKGTAGTVNFLAVNKDNPQAQKKCKSIKMAKKTISITVSGKIK